MLNKKRKGFTIVELVIVIAVIAVLAAVLIPTFSSVVDRAHESAALQEVQNAYINALADALGSELKDTTVEADGFKFTFSDETGQNATIEGPNGFNYSAKVENGVVVLGPASGGSDGAGGDGGGTGGPVTTADALITALAAGGDVTLGTSIEITEPISIPSGKTATINLAGYTLAVHDSSDAEEVIGVAGALTIKDEAEGSGKVVLNADYTSTGIHVKEGGALTLENVDVDGSYCWNIENYGTTTLNKVKVTVPGGYGFANAGTATISECTFTATGEYGTTTIYNHTGTLNVSETTVGESGTVSYSNGAVVVVNDGAVSMEDVTVTAGADAYSVCAKNSSQVTIRGDESAFNTQFLCAYGSSCSFTIYGGTINGTAFEDITAASGIFIGGQHNLTPGDNCWIIAPKS